MNLKMINVVVGTLHFNVSENYCFLPVIGSVSFDGGVGVGLTLATDDELSLAGTYVVAIGCTSPVSLCCGEEYEALGEGNRSFIE